MIILMTGKSKTGRSRAEIIEIKQIRKPQKLNCTNMNKQGDPRWKPNFNQPPSQLTPVKLD